MLTLVLLLPIRYTISIFGLLLVLVSHKQDGHMAWHGPLTLGLASTAPTHDTNDCRGVYSGCINKTWLYC